MENICGGRILVTLLEKKPGKLKEKKVEKDFKNVNVCFSSKTKYILFWLRNYKKVSFFCCWEQKSYITKLTNTTNNGKVSFSIFCICEQVFSFYEILMSFFYIYKFLLYIFCIFCIFYYHTFSFFSMNSPWMCVNGF